ATDYFTKLEILDNHYTWIASLIAVGIPSWVTEWGLTPSKNYNEIPNIRVILIACVMAGVYIHKGDIITLEIRDRAQQAHTSLPFLVLITNLCCDMGVPEITRIDKYQWVNKVLDIKKIQDETNPKMKKRKWEPIVSHPSEATMFHDIQMMDAPSVETLPSSSTTIVTPRLTQSISKAPMIQRSIDKALALVHNRIQDLDHRVSELKCIGVRDAITTLKPNMSKIKNNV
ncbi:hypothetical protein HAX54_049456, partial [Datura stramonium]|nr:hypothetical protein [Datura stramonium]